MTVGVGNRKTMAQVISGLESAMKSSCRRRRSTSAAGPKPAQEPADDAALPRALPVPSGGEVYPERRQSRSTPVARPKCARSRQHQPRHPRPVEFVAIMGAHQAPAKSTLMNIRAAASKCCQRRRYRVRGVDVASLAARRSGSAARRYASGFVFQR